MSTITVPTRMLVGLLADLTLTSGDDPEIPSTRGVLLHTAEGEYALGNARADDGEEPLIATVETMLLVGTSTDGAIIAQAHCPCGADGPVGLLAPIFIELADVKTITRDFKDKVSTLGRERTHYTELTVEAGKLTVRESPAQVPNGLRVSVQVSDGRNFPVRGMTLMEPDPGVLETGRDGEIVPPSYGTGLSARHIEILGKVGKRRQMPLAVYRHHQHRPIVVEIGAGYVAAVNPVELDEESGQHHAPMVRLFTPLLRGRRLEVVGDE